ncbi:glycerol kinase [Legionella taurinensis]|uniref:Glycerol kinase n=1 Tax=Legionella taurinensis TaxID=70611 RepID=A0A3A5L2L5_9GAMM|nr:glycerol kinase GlpK [Legionella taurinensis]MDX1838241.1 glycerol kinase GlpK [Legionella taurinensis]PUT39267.1 glycerol kinase [Legionella taurinensis]PUT44033.1 glycerol kinase [Legionella taurinensis]PUT46295.1 glycerol kinase [Legionella taurinensis]RJT45541.1 glycerol kinase [Legionella taurinensis]
MNYILAIDQGTSSTRAMLYNERFELVATSQYTITQHYPEPGWVEHDPEEIWQKTLTALRDVAGQAEGGKIIACGITNQRETTLLWDKETGKCLSRAIVWQDRRTQAFCESLSEYQEMIREKTGLLVDAYFSATKLHWLLRHTNNVDALLAQKRLAFGTIDSFLIWRLTKGKSHLTDITNASRTMLFNIHDKQWDADLLKLFAIPDALLPEVKACDAYYGDIDASHLGFTVPIHGVAGDQQAALIGQRCFTEGMTKATFGTGGFLLMNTGEQAVLSNHHLLTTIAYTIQGQTMYGIEGSIYQAGTTVKWLRDEMKLLVNAAETEELARSLPSNEGVYLVSAFNGMGAPYWLSTPGAAIFGLSRNTTRAHFARAALEGVCYQTREVLTCMEEDSGLRISPLRVDGGMTVNQWFLQFLASQCQATVQRPHDIETTAQGAALLAALGVGQIGSLSMLEANWHAELEFSPGNQRETVERDFQGWLHAMRMIRTV